MSSVQVNVSLIVGEVSSNGCIIVRDQTVTISIYIILVTLCEVDVSLIPPALSSCSICRINIGTSKC